MGSQTFQDTEVWQKAHEWVLDVYRGSAKLPESERYGLALQLRRAAVSVPANFVEGFKKQSRADKARYYNIAQASLEESRYYLILARDLSYPIPGSVLAATDRVAKMLASYRRAVLNDSKET